MNDLDRLLMLSVVGSVAAVALAVIRWRIMRWRVQTLTQTVPAQGQRATSLILALIAAFAAYAYATLSKF